MRRPFRNHPKIWKIQLNFPANKKREKNRLITPTKNNDKSPFCSISHFTSEHFTFHIWNNNSDTNLLLNYSAQRKNEISRHFSIFCLRFAQFHSVELMNNEHEQMKTATSCLVIHMRRFIFPPHLPSSILQLFAFPFAHFQHRFCH